MAFFSSYTKQPAYTLLEGGEQARRATRRTRLWAALLVLASFLAGTQLHLLSRPKGLDLPERPQLFQYNRSFTERPSEHTDGAWHSLFPRQGGYFRHPQVAPSRSAFAVFHQLHCLDGIRMGYWFAFDAALAGEKKNERDFPFMASPPHVRHCIDLIRQALMCQPDLTLEVKNETKGGVTGFGVEHQCIRWDSLVAWVGEWEGYDQRPLESPEG